MIQSLDGLVLDEGLASGSQENRKIQAIDVYFIGAAQMYTGPGKIVQTPRIILKDNAVIIPHAKIPGIAYDMHDTYKIDRYDNLYDGHTTINLLENKKFRVDIPK